MLWHWRKCRYRQCHYQHHYLATCYIIIIIIIIIFVIPDSFRLFIYCSICLRHTALYKSVSVECLNQFKTPRFFMSVSRASLTRAVAVVAVGISSSAMWTTVAFILSTGCGSWILDLAWRRLIADGRVGSGSGWAYRRGLLVDDTTRPTGLLGRSLMVTSLIIMRKGRRLLQQLRRTCRHNLICIMHAASPSLT